MRRGVAVLCTMLSLFNGSRALALANGSFWVTVSGGAGASTASEEYGGLMVLPGIALAISGGVARMLAGPVWGTGDVAFFRVGRGQFIGRTSYRDPIMDPSSAATAMVGLELAERDQTGPTPFVSGSLGVGHVVIGDMKSGSGSGATVIRRTNPVTAPAFALGVGVRAAPSLSFGVRWVSIQTDGGPMNIVPLTVGISF